MMFVRRAGLCLRSKRVARNGRLLARGLTFVSDLKPVLLCLLLCKESYEGTCVKRGVASMLILYRRQARAMTKLISAT